MANKLYGVHDLIFKKNGNRYQSVSLIKKLVNHNSVRSIFVVKDFEKNDVSDLFRIVIRTGGNSFGQIYMESSNYNFDSVRYSFIADNKELYNKYKGEACKSFYRNRVPVLYFSLSLHNYSNSQYYVDFYKNNILIGSQRIDYNPGYYQRCEIFRVHIGNRELNHVPASNNEMFRYIPSDGSIYTFDKYCNLIKQAIAAEKNGNDIWGSV